MTYRVGAKGQVVLTRELRDELGIRPGDEVLFGRGGDEITVRKAQSKADVVRRLRGALAGAGPSLTDLLLEERRRDREREDHRLGGFM